MTSPSASASVRIEADASDFGPELERAIDRALDAVVDAAGDMASDVTSAANEAGDAIADAAADGAASAAQSLDSVASSAQRAGRGMGQGMENGAEQASRAVRSTVNSLGQLGPAAAGAGASAANALGQAGEDGGGRFSRAVRQAADSARESIDSLAERSVIPPRMASLGSRAAEMFGGVFKKGLAAVGLSAGVAIAATLGSGLNRLVTIDTARTKLRALGNDAQAVESIMKNANAAVKGTAFGMGDAATVAASAVAAGVKPGQQLETYLKRTASAAALAGVGMDEMGRIMNQVTTSGKAMTGDIEMVASRGLDIWVRLSKQMGVSTADVRGMAAAGKISADDFQAAMGTYGDAAKTMGESVAGQFENMKASMSRLGAALIGPLFEQAGPAMQGITNLFDQAEKGATAFGEKANEVLTQKLIPGVKNSWASMMEMGQSSGMFERIGNVWDQVVAIGGRLWNVVSDLVETFAKASASVGFSTFDLLLITLDLLLPVVDLLAAALEGLSGFLTDNQWIVTTLVAGWTAYRMAILIAKGAQLAMTAATWAMNSAFLASPLTWIVLAIAAVVAIIVLIATKTTWFQTIWEFVWGAIKGAAAAVWGFLEPIFTAIGDIFVWLWESVLQPIIDFIVAAFQFWWEGVQLYIRLIMAVLEVLWEALKRGWEYIVKPVIDLLVQGFMFLWSGLEVVFGWIKAGLSAVWGVLTWVWETVVQPVLGFIGAAWQRLYDAVIGPVIGWIKQKFNDFVTGIRVIWDATKQVISNVTGKFNELMGFFGRIGSKIIDLFKGAGKWLWDAGKNIVQGLLDGAGSLLSKIGKFFLDKIPNWIKAPFKKALGIESPSRLFAEYGANIGEGLISGVQSMTGQVQMATQGLAASAASVDVGAVTVSAAGADVVAPVAGAVAGPVAGAEGGADGAFASSAAGLAAVKAEMVDPTMAGLDAGLMAYGQNAVLTLQGTVDPAWQLSAANLMAVKMGLLDPTMAGMNAATTSVSDVTRNSVFNGINPAWQFMGSNVAAVFNGTVNPVMAAMRGAVDHTAAAFGMGASNIANQWNRVREATAAPVRFAITSVFNDGIVGMWNSVSDLLGTQKMAHYPLRFQTGGMVPGTGSGDKVPALLEPKEFVASRPMLKAIGAGNLDRGISMMESVRTRAGSMSGMGPEGLFAAVASRYSAGGVVQGTPAWNALKRAHVFASRWSGKPYVWGGSLGPNGGTDCSGFMSSIADVIHGGSGLHRKWATGAFPGGGGTQGMAGPQGFVRGLSAGFSIGVSSVHTAGTLGGVEGLPTVNVESGGSPSMVKYGAGAVGADHSQFPSRYHLPIASGAFVSAGSGGGGSVSFQDIIGSITGPAREKIGRLVAGWPVRGLIDTYPGAMADKLTKAADKKIEKLIEEMSTFADPGGGGVARWRPLVQLLLARYRLGLENTDRTLRRMNQESGGNPRAINLWDSNAKAGIPSKGLMQVIDPTFAAHRDPMLKNDIWDPMANVGASMRYAMSNYGSLASAYDRAGGYDSGGLARYAGLMPKHVNVPERVLSPRETRAFEAWMDAGGFSGDVIVMEEGNMSFLASRLMDEMTSRGFRGSGGYGFGADGRTTTAKTTVMVNQYVTAPDSRGAADEIERRLLSLI